MTLLSDLDFLAAQRETLSWSPTHQEAYDRLKNAISGEAVAPVYTEGEKAALLALGYHKIDDSETGAGFTSEHAGEILNLLERFTRQYFPAAPHIVASELGEPSKPVAWRWKWTLDEPWSISDHLPSKATFVEPLYAPANSSTVAGEADGLADLKRFVWGHECAIPDKLPIDPRECFIEGAAQKAHDIIAEIERREPMP